MEIKLCDNTVLYEATDIIATVTINREEKRNSLNPNVISGISEALDLASKDENIRLIVITGAGDKAFCAGADLSSNVVSESIDNFSLASHEERRALADLFIKFFSYKLPIVAKVKGYALAGGFGLALACDYVYATSESVFGASEVLIGLWPFIITVPLLNSLPPKKALELVLTGKRVSAQEGKELGFVNAVFDASEIDQAISELAQEIKKASPQAIALGKQSFYNVLRPGVKETFDYLRTLLGASAMTRDAKEGISAFFEKRPPKWAE